MNLYDILHYSIIIQQISTKKTSANLGILPMPPLVESRAGSLWLWWLSPPASRMLKICWTREPVRGKPFSFRISSQIRELGRHGASWGVMGCQIVSGSSNLVLRLVSLCFIQELNGRICESTFVCVRMFGELALRLRLRLKPAVCNMAGCWQHASRRHGVFIWLRRCGVLNLFIWLCLQEIQ